jgi:hypothetical protein
MYAAQKGRLWRQAGKGNGQAGVVNTSFPPMGAAHTAVGGLVYGVTALLWALCVTHFTKSGNRHLGVNEVKILKKFAKKLSISTETQRAIESNREQIRLD